MVHLILYNLAVINQLPCHTAVDLNTHHVDSVNVTLCYMQRGYAEICICREDNEYSSSLTMINNCMYTTSSDLEDSIMCAACCNEHYSAGLTCMHAWYCLDCYQVTRVSYLSKNLSCKQGLLLVWQWLLNKGFCWFGSGCYLVGPAQPYCWSILSS